jgi:hypothetical protein
VQEPGVAVYTPDCHELTAARKYFHIGRDLVRRMPAFQGKKPVVRLGKLRENRSRGITNGGTRGKTNLGKS